MTFPHALAFAALAACGRNEPRTPESVRPQPTPEGAPSSRDSTEPVPADPAGFAERVVYRCAVDARHFGGRYTADSYGVDLSAETFVVARIDIPSGSPPPGPPAQQPLDQVRRDRFAELTRLVLARNDWPSDPALPDGVACSLTITRGNEQAAVLDVQRQQQNRGDAVDQLIVALRGLDGQ